MNNLYNYILAFDWNETPINPTQRPLDCKGPLRNGALDSVGGKITTVLDSVCFGLINRTKGAKLEDPYTIVNGEITFKARDPKTQVESSPFNLTRLEISSIGTMDIMTDSVISQLYPDQSSYPAWKAFVPLIQVATVGDFMFEVTVEIKGPDGTQRQFVTDPEMITGSAG